MTQIPTHLLESARRRLDDMFDPPEDAFESEDPGFDTTDYRMDPDYLTIRDLLEEMIESRHS
jgi:hypothetical protein